LRWWSVVVGLAVGIPGIAVSDDLDALKKRLEQRFGDLHIDELKPTPIAGVYEMAFGTRIAFVTADGRYMITGNLVDLESRRNLTNERRTQLITRTLDAMGDARMIVFAPKQTKRTVTVFTDVDCPYCAKFHQEVPALNRAGVKVRYLLFPRTGKASESYRRAVAVWCSKDRNKTIGIAKAGGKIEMKTCTNPVDDHMALGEDIGVTGTPSLVLDDGRIAPGYVPARELLTLLGLGDSPAPATAQ
jgi:thiol:disulfide interchange protein DsbC